ncbi:MAG: hypothetical protein FD147_2644 [Chloroflexi bacterium]|nr:MAG: hypothetical protein FD147_2644 [Chloroflexota bacterium]
MFTIPNILIRKKYSINSRQGGAENAILYKDFPKFLASWTLNEGDFVMTWNSGTIILLAEFGSRICNQLSRRSL